MFPALIILAAATISPGSPTSPPNGGTIAVIAAADDGREDTMLAREATVAALGEKGFTILDDRNHAAYIADVRMTLAAVGTSVARTRGEAPSMMGGGVNIPLASNRSSLVPMQRVKIEVRIRKRGSEVVIWHGAAVTVRSASASGYDASRLAGQLSRAAINAYPAEVDTAISIP